MGMRMILILITAKIRSFWKKIVYEVAAAIVAGILLFFTLAAPAKITAPSADDFFSSYFGKVTQASQRLSLYDNDVTPDFRKFESWTSYVNLWEEENRVTASEALPGQSPLEYVVTLTFYPAHGAPWKRTIDYYLTCDGFIGAILARDPLYGCPPSLIKIDRTGWVNTAAN